MTTSAQAAANALIAMARAEGQQITNMQVQKHVFLGQGYCLALLDAPLYYNDTHAWQWGPVVAKLYKGLQKYGSGFVTEEIPAEDKLDLNSREYGILKAVWNAYKKYSGSQLSELTHRPGTPWSKTWEKHKFGIIPIDEIKDYYTAQVAAQKKVSEDSIDLGKLIRNAAESDIPNPESTESIDLGIDLEEHRLSFEIDCLQQELDELKDTHKLRLTYTGRIFWLVVAWLACVVTSIVLSGLSAWGFHLSDSVLIAFITSTTVNVVGLFVLVAKWMFPSRKLQPTGTDLQVRSSGFRVKK